MTKIYNTIIIIINKLIKYVIIIPFKKIYNIKQLVFILLDKLIRDYNILKLIILNKDKLFILNYQKILIEIISTKLYILIIYYL